MSETWLENSPLRPEEHRKAEIKKNPLERSFWNRWCPGAESNRRHEDFQPSALPTEQIGHLEGFRNFTVVPRGVEPRILSPLL